MALPTINSLSECAGFSRTVLPYVSELSTLPWRLIQSGWALNELRSIYLTTNPFISGLAMSLFLAPVFLVVSEVNRNYSQVDRCWSILPTLYIAHFAGYAHLAGLPTERLDYLLACSLAWTARLTFNYWRKGGYSIGSEDYRWEVLRQKINPALFFLFNVAFISLAQSLLLFFVASPAYVLLLVSRTGAPLKAADTIFLRILLGLVIFEFVADQQQWDFQQAKKWYQQTAKVPHKFEQEDLDRGFVVTGLWKHSRHPNFAAEQTIWVAVYAWSCFAANSAYNWTGVGAVSYLILFQASTWFTELITSGKYPEYKEYQRRVGRFLPKLYSDLPGDFSDLKAKPKRGSSDGSVM